MNKELMLSTLVEKVRSELERTDRGFERTKNASIEAYGAMESRYDTTKIEQSWLADGLASRISEGQAALTRLSNLELPTRPETACLGAVVVGHDVEDVVQAYFLVPAGGGYELLSDGITVSTITPQSPIGRAILGARIGDRKSINTPAARRFITITEIV